MMKEYLQLVQIVCVQVGIAFDIRLKNAQAGLVVIRFSKPACKVAQALALDSSNPLSGELYLWLVVLHIELFVETIYFILGSVTAHFFHSSESIH